MTEPKKRTSISVTEEVLDLLKQVRVEIFVNASQASQEYEGQLLIMEEPSLNVVIETLCYYWRHMHKPKKKGSK